MQLRSTKSGNSDWLNQLSRSKSSAHFRVIDQTDDLKLKRIVLLIANINGDGQRLIWREFFFYPKHRVGYFDFIGNDVVTGKIAGVYIEPITLENGYNYSATRTGFIRSSGSPTEFNITNDDSSDLDMFVSRNGYQTTAATIAPSATASFRYNPTFYIGSLGVGNPLDLSLVNTQISLLGVATADVLIGRSGGNLNFSLSNVVYS